MGCERSAPLGGAAPAAAGAPVTQLTFTYCGSGMERAAIEGMVTAFEARNPDIDVQAVLIPYEEYLARVTAMTNKGKPPDVGYFPGLQAPVWAREGKLLDLTELVQTDPLFTFALPQTRYYYGDGKIVDLNMAMEATLLFYNEDLFDQAGQPYPPADPAQAWIWEQFVAAARQLTVDVQGLHPGEPGYDPAAITTYGAAFDKTYEGWTWYPFILRPCQRITSRSGRSPTEPVRELVS